MSVLDYRCNIVYVSSDTATVCASLGATGCVCTCSDCVGCNDCTNCPNLTISDIFMKIYRKGTNTNVPPALPTYLFMYPAYTLTGTVVCFFIDVSLTSLVGRYVGDIFVQGNQCGSIEMSVGDQCNVFTPYTVSLTGGIDSAL